MQKTTKLMKTDKQQFIEIWFVFWTTADERIQNDENLEHGAGGTERTQ